MLTPHIKEMRRVSFEALYQIQKGKCYQKALHLRENWATPRLLRSHALSLCTDGGLYKCRFELLYITPSAFTHTDTPLCDDNYSVLRWKCRVRFYTRGCPYELQHQERG